MGLALAAELNGYPGPIHAIEPADQLHLSPDQVSKLRALFEAMKEFRLGLCSSKHTYGPRRHLTHHTTGPVKAD